MKKILYVIGKMDRGGAETFLMNVLRNINHKKYQFVIATFEAPTDGKQYVYADELKTLGVKIVRLRDTRTKKPWDFTKQIEDLVRTEKIDIIHSQIDFMSALTLPGAKQGGAAKLISHSHNTYNSKFSSPVKNLASKILRRRLLKYSQIRLACGEEAGKYLYGAHAKYTVIPNGIDTSKFRFNEKARQTIRKQFHIPADATVLLNVGRLEKQKNQVFLIDIFEEYTKRNANSYLLIIGNGSLRNELKAKIQQSSHKDHIFLLEARSDIQNYYMAADYFLLPSLYEGVPFVGIEAQASGLKCLFSNGTPRESKIIDTTIFLPNEVEKWVNNMKLPNTGKDRTLLNNTEGVKKFDIKQSVKKLEEIYDSN